jgi:hypothetical protein
VFQVVDADGGDVFVHVTLAPGDTPYTFLFSARDLLNCLLRDSPALTQEVGVLSRSAILSLLTK